MTLSDTDQQAAHRLFAAQAFNACWNLIDLPARTPEQDREMRRLAEVSFHHWRAFHGHTATNLSIGLWQLARVYTLSGLLPQALDYAAQCLEVSQHGGIEPFYLAYAYEALARAQSAAGQLDASREATAHAEALIPQITDPDSVHQLRDDLMTIENARAWE